MLAQVAPSAKVFNFLKELLVVIPNIYYYPRKKNALKKMIEWAKEKDFTDFLIVAEKAKKPTGLYISHLPEGPTSFWKMTRLKLGADIEVRCCVYFVYSSQTTHVSRSDPQGHRRLSSRSG